MYIVLYSFDYKPYVWKTNLPANKCKNLYTRNTNKLQWQAYCTKYTHYGLYAIVPTGEWVTYYAHGVN